MSHPFAFRAARLVRASLLVAALVVAPHAHALSVIPPTFSELVAEATQIVRVEVIETTARLSTSQHGPVIHTYVRTRVLRQLKGERIEGELTLRLQGGQVGTMGMEIPGMPQFKPGERCMVFVEKNGTAFCPLVAAMHGRYHIVTDPATGLEHVLRDNRDPLRAVDDVVLPMQLALHRDRSINQGIKLSAFEAAIDSKVRDLTPNARRR